MRRYEIYKTKKLESTFQKKACNPNKELQACLLFRNFKMDGILVPNKSKHFKSINFKY